MAQRSFFPRILLHFWGFSMGETMAEIRARLAGERNVVAPVRKAMKGRRQHAPDEWLSAGAALLNVACTGDVHKGYKCGHYFFWVGDSATGKTFICLLALAEAANDPKFDGYDLIFVNAENGAEMVDKVELFGSKLKERLDIIKAEDCGTIEKFYRLVYDRMSARPCIILLDSMDALSSNEEIKNFMNMDKPVAPGEKSKGSYALGKAKANSQLLRIAFNKIVETKSILIMISQTRDNIGFDAKFRPKTRSGGRALKFYAGLEMWTSQGGHLYKTVNGKPREQGIIAQIRIEKNRLSGKDRTVRIPIYHSVGIDDTGACIDYLVDEKHWKTTKLAKGGDKEKKQKVAEGKITAHEFDFVGTREKLAEHIEQNGLREQLYSIVQSVWTGIENEVAIKRLPRYE